jgi:hypothetical protein
MRITDELRLADATADRRAIHFDRDASPEDRRSDEAPFAACPARTTFDAGSGPRPPQLIAPGEMLVSEHGTWPDDLLNGVDF